MTHQNYIYLKYYNYLYHEQAPEMVFATTRKRTLQSIRNKQQLNTSTRQQIEDTLNYFYDATYGDFTKIPSLTQKTYESLITAVSQYVSKAENATNTAITSTLKAGRSKYSLNGLFDIVERLDNKMRVKISTIETRMRKLEKLRDDLVKNNQSDQQLIQDLQKIITEWNNIKTLMGGNNQSYIKIADYNTFFTEYNNLIDNLFVQDTNITGTTLEAMTAGLMYIAGLNVDQAKKLVVSDIEKILDTNVVGKKTSQKGFNASALLSPMLTSQDLIDTFSDKEVKSVQKYNGEQLNMVLNADSFGQGGTQDKVDIVFTFDNKPIKATLKNYDLSQYYARLNGIHLAGGTNPFVLLSKEAKFLQHYFNVTSEHGYTDDDYHNTNGWVLEPPATTVVDAHKLAREIMFARALIGGQFTYNHSSQRYGHNDEAQLFIINDTSEGRFRVYLVQDLVQQVVDNFNLVKVKGYPEDNLFKYDISGWENMSNKERMMKIYAQMNRFKLDIYLDFNQIIHNVWN